MTCGKLFTLTISITKQRRKAIMIKTCTLGLKDQKLFFSSGPEQFGTEKSTNTSFLHRVLFEIRRFSKGMELLLNDYRTYCNIESAAASSRNNAWVNGIPRRQLEQRRQFLLDLQIALPTVSLFMLPIVGYIAPLLATVFPRQMLSKQFQTTSQHRKFAQVEYNMRKVYFAQLTDLLIRCYHNLDKDTTTTIVGLTSSNLPAIYDEAGPVICNMGLLIKIIFYPMIGTATGTLRMHSFLESEAHGTNLNISALSTCAVLEALSKEHLHILFMTSGYTKLPLSVANFVYNRYLFPSEILKSIVRKVGSNIVHDDASLLRELGDMVHHHDSSALSRLTDDEIFEACLLRGLPIDLDNISTFQMRKCLFNHLLQMRSVKFILSQQELNVEDNKTKHEIRWPSNYKEPVHDFLILLSLQLVSVRFGLMQARDLPT